MVNLPGQFERSGRTHSRNVLAKNGDHLLVGVTITIIDNDTRFHPVAGSGRWCLCRDRGDKRGGGTSHRLQILADFERGVNIPVSQADDWPTCGRLAWQSVQTMQSVWKNPWLSVDGTCEQGDRYIPVRMRS